MLHVVLTVALGSLVVVGFGQQQSGVQWSASTQHGVNGHSSLVRLRAVIPKGWHVYGVKQLPGGPTPLVIRIEQGAPYEISGMPQGTIPQKHHDASFDLDIEYFTDSIELNFPVRTTSFEQNLDVPLVIRFQMCSDTTCLPPRTIHLIAKPTS
jgi:hypothetical protein